MDVLVTEQYQTEYRTYFEMICGKKKALVSYDASLNHINVLCMNASNAAWGFSAGRTFRSWEEAKKGYKSKTMLRMIEFVEDELKPVLKIVS